MESPFVIELLDGKQCDVVKGVDVPDIVTCPKCQKGSLVSRKGPYGAFLGCSTFPRCRHTQKILGDVAAQ